MKPTATIVFTTYNRQELLHQAIQSAQKQSVPVHIIVMDDASSDGTAEMMAAEFPEIEYHRSEQNKGPCYQRNRGIELAKTDIVFPLDDDSVLQSPFTVEQTLAEFNDPRVGAVAIPFINKLQNQHIHTQAPNAKEIYLTHAFVAASHAVDRRVFLEVGGYREFFFYMGEEGDFCIRLLQQKCLVRLGRADPIHHFQPPNRISIKADMFGRRNDILFCYFNTPIIFLVPNLMGTTIKGMLFGFKVKRPINMLEGCLKGYKMILLNNLSRHSVSQECFKLFRILKKRGCVPLKEVELYFENTEV